MILKSIVNEESTPTSKNYLCENPNDPTGSGIMHVSFCLTEPPSHATAVMVYPGDTTRFTPKPCHMTVAYNHIHVWVPAGDLLVWARVGETFRINPFTNQNHHQLRSKKELS